MTDIERIEIFRLSDIGEGLTDAEITGVRVQPGDTVEVNQVLLDIETAKVAVELPSPFAGRVTAVHVHAGEVVKVGGALVSIAVAGPPTVLVGSGPTTHGVERRPRRSVVATEAVGSSRVQAAPAARRRALELGIDIATVSAAMPGQPIGVADVERASAAATVAPNDPPGVTRSPIRGVRRATAEAMSRSAFTAPHVAEWVDVDVTELMGRLHELRRPPEGEGVPVTPLTFAARALIAAALAHPDINASWDAERNEIVHFADVNLGIACATPRGLVVPNVPAAQQLGFTDLALAIAALVHRARAGETTLDEVRHGTISITNIGSLGVDGGIPILNPGEAAILCLGQIRERPWVVDHALAVRSVLTLTLCFDHRLVDGELGSKVLRAVANALEAPETLLGGPLTAGGVQ